MTDWKDDRSPRDRVRQIVETVTDPVSVNWVAQQADVGWQTAKDELERLAEGATLRRVERADNLRYVPDFTHLYTERIRDLALSFTAEELRDEIVEAKSEIESIQSAYGVQSREELAASLSDPGVSADETRERQRSLREWEEIADQLQLLEHALAIQDDLYDVDPQIEAEGSGDAGQSGVASMDTEVV